MPKCPNCDYPQMNDAGDVRRCSECGYTEDN